MKYGVDVVRRTLALVSVFSLSVGCASLALDRTGESDRSAVLAIFTATADGYLEQAEECGNPSIVCLDPPPVRFHANVIEWIHGRAASYFNATTTDHFGVESYLFQSSLPKLGLFLRWDGQITLPRYAWSPVWRDRDGEWWTPAAAWFLPCSIEDLAEPLRIASLEQRSLDDACPENRVSPSDDPDGAGCQHESLEAIRISRLRMALSALKPADDDWRCDTPTENPED